LKIKASFITAAIALGASCAFADPLQPSFERALPPAKINAIVHSMGLVPVGQPIRKGFTYVVYANNRLGRSVRIVVDARFGKVLAVQRVIAVIPPGTYPVPQPVDGASTRPYAPDQTGTPVIRPPDVVARPPAPLPLEKPDRKPTTGPASPTPAVVTIGTSSTKPVADPKPTGNTSSPSFPPVQSLE
jgi:hypothetical protein